MNKLFFKQKQTVLGIETSCDETAVAVYDTAAGLLSHEIYSQIALHNQHGGIVPELASRDHIKKLTPLIDKALLQANLSKHDLSAIAYTAGPGLIGSLMVGAAVARALAYALAIKAIPVHHMEAHLLAPLLDNPAIKLPFIALLVSGGHTMLVKVRQIGSYEVIGESLDDAAGEAFDKTARLLGLSYPGGPQLAKLAKQGRAGRFTMPRPMTNRPGLDFSFSGLKTQVITTLAQTANSAQDKADMALAFETAVAETMRIKCERALKQTGINNLIVAGGVSANQRMRATLIKMASKIKAQVFFPRLEFCTDNGAMIAFAGALNLAHAQEAQDLEIIAKARWPMVGIAHPQE